MATLRMTFRHLIARPRVLRIACHNITTARLTPLYPASATNNLRKMSSPTAPLVERIQFSEGCDPSVARPKLDDLLTKEAGRWELCQDAQGITREFKFKSFKQAWAFMSAVAEECSVEKHHPEWSNVYNRVSVTWTTHRPRGLSLKDLRMAEFSDEQAAKHKEIMLPPPFPEQNK